MRKRRRAFAVLLCVAAVSFTFAIARIFVHFTAPPPRWDLAVPFAVPVFGLAGGLVLLKRGKITIEESARTSRFWWAHWRGALVWTGCCAVPFAVFMVAFAGVSYSSRVWHIHEEGASIRWVEVQDVLESDWRISGKTSYYMIRARVDIPYPSGTRSQTDRFRSESSVDEGDSVRVLYAPNSPELGIVLARSRFELESGIGGPAPVYAYLALAAVLFMLSLIFPALFSRPSTALARHRKRGVARTARFTVTHGGVDQQPDGKGKHAVVPVLRLRGPEEEATLRLDPLVDPIDATNLLMGEDVTLYWALQPGSKHGPERILAVLVAKEGHCLQGTMDPEDKGLPEGTTLPAGKYLPEGRGLRALRTSPVWDPAIHTVGVTWLLVGEVCLLVAVLGVHPLASVASVLVAFCSPFFACSAVKRKRQAYLKGLAPETTLPEVPA